MKRIVSILLALCMLAVLAGCGKKQEEPPKTDEPAPPAEDGITLAELNVEFVAGERDTDDLMALKKAFPPLLISALAERNVMVGKVNVTFGASDEATADALEQGTVQVGFLPLETYLAHKDGMSPASSLETPAAGIERIGLYLPVSDQNRTLRAEFEENASKDGTLSAWEVLLRRFETDGANAPAVAVPADDEVAMRLLDMLMGYNANGMTADSISRLTEYTDVSTAFSDAALVVLRSTDAPDAGTWTEIYSCPISGEVVAVSAADDIVNSPAFLLALGDALASMQDEAQQVLRLYHDGADTHYQLAREKDFYTPEYLLGYSEAFTTLSLNEE